jgi:hypothetical protein
MGVVGVGQQTGFSLWPARGKQQSLCCRLFEVCAGLVLIFLASSFGLLIAGSVLVLVVMVLQGVFRQPAVRGRLATCPARAGVVSAGTCSKG